MSERVYYGILNTELEKMITSARGKGIWKEKQHAEDVLEGEFGGENNLTLVNVILPKQG